MTEAQVLQLINQFIIANGNNEITANVLRPILEEILKQPNNKIGNREDLATEDKSDIVAAINEVLNKNTEGFKVHAGSADPNVTPPANYSIGDWYIRNGQFLYQFNGYSWTANQADLQSYILLDEKGQPLGVATLDSNGKIPDSQLGDLAITDIIPVTETTLASFLPNSGNYTYQKGDVIVITDAGVLKHYMYKGGTKTASGSYSQITGQTILISQVQGLQAALDLKQDKNTAYRWLGWLNASSDINTVISNVTSQGWFTIGINRTTEPYTQPSGMPSDFVYSSSGGQAAYAALKILLVGGVKEVSITDFEGNIYSKKGNSSTVTPWLKNSATGQDGKDALEVWQEQNPGGTYADWIEAITGPKGDPFTVDAQGVLAERDAYDSEATGFSFFATDTSLLYFKTDTGWTSGTPFGKGDDGDDGREVELRKTATHIQWRYTDGAWVDLVALEELAGIDDSNLLHKTGDETKTGNLTIVGKNSQAFVDTRNTETRPVVNQIELSVNPNIPVEAFTDFHGYDINHYTAGGNINALTRLFSFQLHTYHNTGQDIDRIVANYLLVENQGTGKVAEALGLQMWNRNNSTGEISLSRNILIKKPRNDGGGVIKNAYGIFIENFDTASFNNYGIYSSSNNFFRKIEVQETGLVTNLNAQYINGITRDRLIFGDNVKGSTRVLSLNTITKSGFYITSSAAEGNPTAHFYAITHNEIDTSLNYASQIATQLTGGSQIFYRTNDNGTWGAWDKLVTEKTLKETARTYTAIQTHSVSPIVPTPTTDPQVANKKYVDDKAIPQEHQINGTRLTDPNVSGTFNFDWDAYSQFVLTPTGATTLGNTNLPTGTNSKEIKGIIKAGSVVTKPANWNATADSDAFDNSLDNHFRAWVSADNVVTFTNKNKAVSGSTTRTPKPVPYTTQYTFVPEDFTTNSLRFTANAGETINVILNAGVQPVNGSLQIVIEGDCKLNFTYGTGVTAILPPGAIGTTLGKGSWIGSEYISANVISWNGDLDGTGQPSTGERPFKEIDSSTYALASEDAEKYLLFRSTDCVFTLDPNEINDGEVIKGVCYSASLVQFTSSSQIIKPGTKAAEISTGGSFEIKYKASLAAFILTGDLIPV